MMKINRKIKSFGIVEAVISSLVVIIVLSAAVFLSMSATKTTEVNSSYSEAQHISDLILERIQLIKSNGRLYFDKDDSREPDMISIDCFGTSEYLRPGSVCQRRNMDEYPLDQFPYLNLSLESDSYVVAPEDWFNESVFGAGYFRFMVNVEELDACHTSGSVLIDESKCREVSVSVKWQEQSREQIYKQTAYITDWER